MRVAVLFVGFLATSQADTLTVSQVKADYTLLFPCRTVITDSTVAHHPLGPFVRECGRFGTFRHTYATDIQEGSSDRTARSG
jgi:hypothetical protein